jgi:hypothetical protein
MPDSIEQLKTDVQQDMEKLKASGTGVIDEAQQLETKVAGAPKWKLIVAAICVCCVAGYLCWSLVHTPAPKPGAIIHPAPAVTAPKVEGPMLKVPLRVVPKPDVLRKFPQIGTIAPALEVVDTAIIPATDNGGSTITFTNVTTGLSSTVFIPKAAPWFALESRNTLGVGYEAATSGTRVPVYYRRDLVRVKDLHLVGEVGGKIPLGVGKIEGHAGAYAEWRF